MESKEASTAQDDNAPNQIFNQNKNQFNNQNSYYSNQNNNQIIFQKQNQHYYNPNMQLQMLYHTKMYIYSTYKNLIDINTKNSEIPQKINNNSKFFVIKSFSEEDIHKSIKYGVWSSSKNGNITLSNAFNITKEKGGNVYLFFSCNRSGRYVGVAKMKTECDYNKYFDYWTQDGKWPGLFDVEWLFIKDVPFKEFKDIIIIMKDGKAKKISDARNTQEIPYEQAKIMLNKIEKYQNSNTILEHFEFYDMRQANYDKNKQAQMAMNNKKQNNISNNNNFNVSSLDYKIK